MGLLDPQYLTGYPNIEDRRSENFGGAWNDDGSFAWQRIPQTLKALGVDVGNSIWGTPQIPEAPDTPLSDALGKRDIRIVPQVNSRSPLDRAIDTATDEVSRFRAPGEKLGSDVPFTQREFSKGYFAPQSFASLPPSGGLNPQYLDAIKQSEGYSAAPAWDYKQSSSGYGTRAQPGDENIPPDQLKQVHEQRFQDETAKAAAAVDKFAPDLPPGVRAALTSLTYNAGPGWQQSGLGEAIKSGDFDKAQGIFLQYNKAGGEVNPGLVARRQKEAAWFGGNAPAPAQTAPATPAGPPSAPLNIAPQGLLAQQSQPAQQGPLAPQPQQQAGLGGYIPQAPEQAMQAPPIQFAQRRPINLAALKSAFPAPTFFRG